MRLPCSIIMDFAESEDILAIRDTLRRFIARECPDSAVREWEKSDAIPREMSVRLGTLGLGGLCVPEEYGGLGRQVIAMTVVLDELTRCSNALSALYNMSAGYGGLTISESGT